MFEDMARLGYPLFQKRVADYYLKEKNYDMAVPWYKELVEAKDSVTSTYALHRLINIYTDSPTVKDPVQAANCYVKLGDRTSTLYCFYYAAELYYETGMYNEAVKYFTMARNSQSKACPHQHTSIFLNYIITDVDANRTKSKRQHCVRRLLKKDAKTHKISYDMKMRKVYLYKTNRILIN